MPDSIYSLKNIIFSLFDIEGTKTSELWKKGEREKEIIEDFFIYLSLQNRKSDYYIFCDLALYKETFDIRKHVFVLDTLSTKGIKDFIETELGFLRGGLKNPLGIADRESSIVYLEAYEVISSKCIEIYHERIQLLDKVLSTLPEGCKDYKPFEVPKLNSAQITLLLYELGILDKIHKHVLKKGNVSELARFIQPFFPEEPINTIKPRINPLINSGSNSKSDVQTEKNKDALELFLSFFDLKITDLKNEGSPRVP